MKKATVKNNILTCECGGTEFNVGFQVEAWYPLKAQNKSAGWGKADILEVSDAEPITGMTCDDCGTDIEITPEVIKGIREIGG